MNYNFDNNQNYFNNNIDYYSDNYNDDNYGLILNETPQGYNYNNVLYPPPNYPNYSNYPIYPETFNISNYDVPAITPINNMSKNHFAGSINSTPMQQPMQQPMHPQMQQPIRQPMQQPIRQPMQPPIRQPIRQPMQPPMQQIPISQIRTPAQKYSHYAGYVTSDRGELANILYATGWDERPEEFNEPIQWLGLPQEYSSSFQPLSYKIPQRSQFLQSQFIPPSFTQPQFMLPPFTKPPFMPPPFMPPPFMQQPNFILKILLIIILFILLAILVAVICKKNKQNKLKEHFLPAYETLSLHPPKS
jgi:hypothetical protein